MYRTEAERWRFVPQWLAVLFIFVGGTVQGANVAKDVAVLDQILSKVQSDQDLVEIGDMTFKGSVLRSWRDVLAGAIPQSAFDGGVNTWPGGVVPYTFDSAVTVVHRRAFVDAAQEWVAFANLQFVPRTSESDYVTVQNCACGGGNSAVGRIGGQQFINIGSWTRATLCHEIGHTLGLVHEHQRSDRDSFVTILWANIQPGTEGNFILLPNLVSQGAYDFYSTMHYARNAFSIDPNTLDTIQPLPAFSQFLNIMGQQAFDRALSVADRNGMAAVYGANPTPPSSIVTDTKDSGPGSLRTAIYYAIDHPGTSITFNIPTSDSGFGGGIFLIQPTDQLPRLGAGTILDGATQASFTGNSNPSGPEIVLNGSLAENFIDGLKIAEANCTVRNVVINGFSLYGVEITGTSAMNNAIEGCYVGLNDAGSVSVPNAFGGVAIFAGASGNRVGGTTAAVRNVISGNATTGIQLADAGTANNVVQGNYVGLDATGNGLVPNAWSGIDIVNGAQSNLIGGTGSSARNLISGNGNNGIYIADAGTSANLIQGNCIGLDAEGGIAGNSWSGIALVNGAQSNIIGGTASGAGNVISGNGHQGMAILGSGTSANLVQGNIIGLDAVGNSAVGNAWPGVEIAGGAQSNTIGGNTAAARNVISGNTHYGVSINGSGTAGNLVQGNYIGVNATGSAGLGNTFSGVAVFGGAQSNTIGGAQPGSGNIISGNLDFGILLADFNTTGNDIQGNYIGLGAAGTQIVPNAFSGIIIYGGAHANTIGGTSGGTRNFISGNGDYGVAIHGSGTTGNLVQGNTIGLDTASAAAGNMLSGVTFHAGAQANSVGGTGSGAGNVISANGQRGVEAGEATTTGNAIQGNSIYNNGELGINLLGGTEAAWGTTVNDTADADIGPNNLQNFPVLTSAVLGIGTVVQGTLNSESGKSYRIEFFASPAADSSGYGEGQYFLGAQNVTTDGSGNASVSVTLASAVPAGNVITATATDPNGNTSEFSAAVTVTTTDTDGDGIPDSYELAHGLNPLVDDAADDLDGDGRTNLEEFLSGTDPQAASSKLDVASVNQVGTDVSIGLATVAGQIYRLEYRDAMDIGNWAALIDQIVGTGGTMTLTDSGGGGLLRRFYRFVVLP